MMASAGWLAHNTFGMFIESTTPQVHIIKTTLDTAC